MITQKGKKLILLISVIGVVLVCFAYTYGPVPRQLRNMSKAKEYAAAKMNEIKGLEDFHLIQISEFTARGGSVFVRGYVKNEKEEQELKNIVYTDDLPTEVTWGVKIIGDDFWEEFLRIEMDRDSIQTMRPNQS